MRRRKFLRCYECGKLFPYRSIGKCVVEEIGPLTVRKPISIHGYMCNKCRKTINSRAKQDKMET